MSIETPPLSLYVHFPWCIRKCPYCDFNSHTLRGVLPEEAYIDALIIDLEQEICQLEDRPIISIFIGGGTPSLFSPESLFRLMQAIRARCCLDMDIEITLEANPGASDYERFSSYRNIGINRLSLGVQSFQTIYLQRLGRIHNGETAQQAINVAKLAGFTNLNIDLMYGLPQQSIQNGLDDLNLAIQFKPTHIAWYQMTLEPNTAFFRNPPTLPTEESIWQLQQQGLAKLAKHGFIQYEISAHAKLGFECNHNCNYWEFGDYIGIGAGAYGKLTDLQNQKIIRYWKQKNPKDYLARKNDFLGERYCVNSSDLSFEFMLNAFRLRKEIAFQNFERYTGLSKTLLEKPLQSAQKKGLLVYDDKIITLTDLGQRFYNDLVMLFMD